jgi:hypothetical protein
MRLRYSPGTRTGDVGRTRTPETQIADLQFEVERLLMVTEALWDIIRERHGMGEEELAARVNAIDMEDGRLDGRVTNIDPPQHCPQCNRVLSKHRPRCIYCGEPVGLDPFVR